MNLLDGKALSLEIQNEIKQKVDELLNKGERPPHLAAILVGNDGASKTYVGHKVKMCNKVGFKSTLIELPETISERELLTQIDNLNNHDDLDGFIVQLPLPKHINVERVTEAINHKKDVDGFHPINIGRMTQGLDTYLPATPYGIIQLLERNGIETSGKHCVVVGRSNIVGTPISIMLSRNNNPGNCTVTLTHSRTQNLAAITRQADILIVALGIPNFIKEDMLKQDVVIVDVGITRVSDSSKKSGYRLVGDVDFDSVSSKCSWITPVPGGVGPMTVTSLLLNTLKARTSY